MGQDRKIECFAEETASGERARLQRAAGDSPTTATARRLPRAAVPLPGKML